ncbi:MAG TPA: cell wall hydrolase [Pseudolabrys sp.]|jgi:spore germination cell wall hydrolase CwlJ-like protein|nr:cell wall hydrolase [Pseudolabrys sp.]
MSNCRLAGDDLQTFGSLWRVGVIMRVPRKRRKLVPFAASLLTATLLPTGLAFQDLGALLVHQPSVSARWRAHMIASPFGTIHAAMFSLPRPLGTTIPHPPVYALANFDPNEIATSIGALLLGDGSSPLQFPSVNRKDKGDALVPRPREPLPTIVTLSPAEAKPPSDFIIAPAAGGFAARVKSLAEIKAATQSTDNAPLSVADVDVPYKDIPPPDITKAEPPEQGGAAAQLYFGVDPLTSLHEVLAPWHSGEAPVVVGPDLGDGDVKLSALAPQPGEVAAGESVAAKGEVTGPEQRPLSPAERLHLSGKTRVKAEKCLANAVYFEARGEPVRGQIAVAQVVMNRVFSGFYPKDVCGVVYQNANRHLACQFTFACDGIPDIVTEPDAWDRAKRIAADMLDGKLWMPEVAKSTHYHASWVHPAWVAEMKRVYRLGVHTFYRPRAWGDGSDEPHWGNPKFTAAEAKRLEIE